MFSSQRARTGRPTDEACLPKINARETRRVPTLRPPYEPNDQADNQQRAEDSVTEHCCLLLVHAFESYEPDGIRVQAKAGVFLFFEILICGNLRLTAETTAACSGFPELRARASRAWAASGMGYFLAPFSTKLDFGSLFLAAAVSLAIDYSPLKFVKPEVCSRRLGMRRTEGLFHSGLQEIRQHPGGRR